MNTPVPKQFLLLDGKPVLMHTISRFVEADPTFTIIVVLGRDQFDFWTDLCKKYNFNIPFILAEGGGTRFESVRSGLRFVEENSIVAVHDAVRPLVTAKTILTACKAAEMYGNAVPAIPLQDSIREIISSQSIAVDRTRFCLIQTPQCFRSELLHHAYSQEFRYTFTDDASVVESAGEKIHLIDGNADNLKITTPKDLIVAEALLRGTIG